MAAYGRPSLRDLFDESPTPHIAHPPRTHHRDFYLATDGSFTHDWGGIGVVIETRDGTRVSRLSKPDTSPDNNVAEYRALHVGLDVLAERTPPGTSVAILVDHDELARNVNATTLSLDTDAADLPYSISVPADTDRYWHDIRARIGEFHDVRAASIPSDVNPAHVLANAPDLYAHVNDEPSRCVRPHSQSTGERVPPPSRADRGKTVD